MIFILGHVFNWVKLHGKKTSILQKILESSLFESVTEREALATTR